MLQLLSFGFHRIPYKSEIIKNYLSKNNETCRADSFSDKDSKNINCVGECPNCQGRMAGKSGKMDQTTGNSFVMSTGRW